MGLGVFDLVVVVVVVVEVGGVLRDLLGAAVAAVEPGTLAGPSG